MKKVRLGDIATVITKGTTPTTLGYNFVDDGVNFVKIESITENGEFLTDKFAHITDECDRKLSRSQLQRNDLLFSIAGAIGRTAIVTEEILPANTNQALAIIRVPEGVIDYSYLKYVLQSPGIVEQFEKKKQGVAQLNISLKDIGDFVIPLCTEEEQKTVVSTLDKVSELIALRKEQFAKLDQLVKSRFIELSNEGDCQPMRMGDIATYINGFAFKPTHWGIDGKPIIRIQNLNDPKAKYNYYDGDIGERYLAHNGDVLISWATHLEAYIWKGPDAWVNQHIFRVVFDKCKIDKTYFVYATEEALREAFKYAHGFKPTMEHIKRSDFENAVVSVPELSIQQQFAAFVEQTDKSKLAIQQSLEKLELLKKSLMQEYFG